MDSIKNQSANVSVNLINPQEALNSTLWRCIGITYNKENNIGGKSNAD